MGYFKRTTSCKGKNRNVKSASQRKLHELLRLHDSLTRIKRINKSYFNLYDPIDDLNSVDSEDTVRGAVGG